MLIIYDFLSIKNPYKYPPRAYLNIVRDQFNYAVKQLKNYCLKNRIDLIFVLFPHLTDKYPIPELKIVDFIGQAKKILDSNSIYYIDLRAYFKSNVDTLSKLRLAPEDTCHLNSLGHKLTADSVYNYLIKYLKNRQQ